MAVKATRILLGTYAAGGPHFLSENDVARIHARPDERSHRQRQHRQVQVTCGPLCKAHLREPNSNRRRSLWQR